MNQIKPSKTHPFWRYMALGLLALVILGAAGFLVWAANPAQPESRALDSLTSTAAVQYDRVNQWLVFTPQNTAANTGLIFYPGGRVDPRAYAPQAQAIAENGFLVIVVPMPLNLAFLASNRAAEVVRQFPSIENWVVGGHSLGGAMAAQFAAEHPQAVDGLALWAAYPAESNDLTGQDLDVISIYATQDGLATEAEIAASRDRLPEETVFVEITGGNHAGFGWYGPQSGDGTAEISQERQQALVVTASVRFLESFSESK
jgi:acetyl esterase/lipase